MEMEADTCNMEAPTCKSCPCRHPSLELQQPQGQAGAGPRSSFLGVYEDSTQFYCGALAGVEEGTEISHTHTQ